jgi:hypothetical protein
MKKLAIPILFLLISSFAFSQSTYRERPTEAEYQQQLKNMDGREVGNFIVTDSDGITWNLHDVLENGQTVLLDLFQST